MIKNIINHIIICLDESSSMKDLRHQVVKVVDNHISFLASKSKSMNQETRVSVYSFNDVVKNLIWDKDVLRLPSINEYYSPNGWTSLMDAVYKGINDQKKVPQLYGDSSYWLIAVTDGDSNRDQFATSETLSSLISTLPDNWTVSIFVPNTAGVYNAKKCGFPASNIEIWDTTSKGLDEVDGKLRKATETYMENRSKGIRGSKNLFSLDGSKLSTKVILNNLDELSPRDYELIPVRKDKVEIKTYIEDFTGKDFRVGSAYYLLSKPEKIQPSKEIAVQNKRNGKIYVGGNARKLVGLPDYEVKVGPGTHGEFDFYIQSKSFNRKLVKDTFVLVLK